MATTTPATAAAPPPTSPSSAPTPAPQIHTYHCICTQLLLATTTPLPSLPRRGGPTAPPSSDNAYILPLPPRPPTSAEDTEAATEANAEADAKQQQHYALLLNVTTERKPRIVQRDDGLEKRWGQRCARCRCVVGYMLDWAHFGEDGKAGGRRGDVVFLLPGGLVGTGEMAGAGAKAGEGAA